MSKPRDPSAREVEKHTRQSVRRDLRGLHATAKDEAQQRHSDEYLLYKHETPEVVGDPWVQSQHYGSGGEEINGKKQPSYILRMERPGKGLGEGHTGEARMHPLHSSLFPSGH